MQVDVQLEGDVLRNNDTLKAVWFRRDFRLHDHTALNYAIEAIEQHSGKWLAFFYLAPQTASVEPVQHDYFFQTVMHFKRTLKASDGDLYIITGTIEDALSKLLQAFPEIDAVYANDDRVGDGRLRDEAAEHFLTKQSIPFYTFEDAYLTEPDQVLKKDGTPYKVFTPYYKAWTKERKRTPAVIKRDVLLGSVHKGTAPDRDAETLFNNLIKKCSYDWSAIGEEHAIKRLQMFTKNRLSGYKANRDFPSITGTSRLSPYIKTGALSIRSIYYHILNAEADSYSAETFLKELAWRDFYRMVHFYEPDCKDREIMEGYRELKWSQNQDDLTSWIRGETGFPIVDAGMRQLSKEGWMHNRLRMITASFLTKDLLIDWRLGERYFERMLIDYNPSSNIGGWQWAASVGTDAVPYFRIFNPVTQSKRFDENGTYIRTYIPELNNVPDQYIHEPWKMSEEEQVKYKCKLDEDYPLPIVDHSKQRKKALSFFKGDDEE